MSTQSYYKDRLGFDPREALYDGPVKGARGNSQTSRYTSSNGANNADNYATPPKKHKQKHQQQHQANYQQQHEASPQGGYEDALTQVKGSKMSVWEYFVENTDKLGMSVLDTGVKLKNTNTLMHAPS